MFNHLKWNGSNCNFQDSKHESDYEGQKSLVYCTGKDVYHYLMTSSDSFVDRRSYKGQRSTDRHYYPVLVRPDNFKFFLVRFGPDFVKFYWSQVRTRTEPLGPGPTGFGPWNPDEGGALPSTLKICQRTATLDTLRVAIGFTAGQLQIIDMATQDDNKRSLQKINDERSIGRDL